MKLLPTYSGAPYPTAAKRALVTGAERLRREHDSTALGHVTKGAH